MTPIKIATAGFVGVGAVGLGAEYAAWHFYSEPSASLASDDFFDQCRHFGAVAEPGQYERALSHYRDDQNRCKAVVGVCDVVRQADGQVMGMTNDAKTRHETAFAPNDCTFLGWLTQPAPTLRKVN